jgi:ParB/RepB/Spo0J family partition protein
MAKLPQRNPLTYFMEPQGPPEIADALELPLNQIDENPWQPRREFALEAMADLTASVKVHGVLQPITVRPAGDRWQVVYGARRLRAARAADLPAIPALVRPLTDAAMQELALTENLQRADLTLAEEVAAVAALQALIQRPPQALADRLGKSYYWVWRRLLLAERPDVVAAVQARLLTQRQAVEAVLKNLDVPAPAPVPTEAAPSEAPVPPPPEPVLHRAKLVPARLEEFRHRPFRRFQQALQAMDPYSVPPVDRSSVRQRIAEIRLVLDAWEQVLSADAPPADPPPLPLVTPPDPLRQ